jgi:hypothetical protein
MIIKDTTIANTVTAASLSMVAMDYIELLTVLSLSSAVLLNVILIIKNVFFSKKKDSI